GSTLLFLAGALLFPVGLLFLSTFTPSPLYHIRYVFTYSPAFYLLLGMAFAGWTREAHLRARLPGAVVVGFLLLTPLLLLSGESLQRFWNDDRYAADDLRGGVKGIQERWRAGDLLLVNAGYSYTAVNHYLEAPIAWQGRLVDWRGPAESEGLTVLQSGSIGGASSLGWGLPESDFYATTEGETLSRLDQAAQQAPRLWHLRLYDTVTDPEGVIRSWLEEHALLFYDQVLTGESNARAQGWYFPPSPEQRPSRAISTRFMAPNGSGSTWLTLHGVDAPGDIRDGGSWADLTLWLQGNPAMDPSLRFSVGLFDTTPAHRQWAVADEQPLGPLLSLQEVPGMQRWPVRLPLPQGIPPGKYEARLKFYRPSDGAVLEGQGERMENREQVRIAVVEIGPTPSSDVAPKVGTPLEADFGALHLLGHSIPAGPWEPGASIPIELVWRVAEPAEDSLRTFVSSNALSADDGGVAQLYPPSQWQPGGIVRDIHYVTVAPDATPGDYPLSLRVSQGTTTIPWTQGFFRSGELLTIGTLTIRDRPRVFEPPEIATALDVTFGDSIQLVGATLPAPRYRPGQEVPLMLHWYAVTRPAGRYKIFTHLIGPDGNLRAQRDLEPGDGRWPTSGWARGEYVSTSYSVSLPADAPPGQYEVRIGLYDPITNERVPLVGANSDAESRYFMVGTIEVGEVD
ncbi:MAG: hypothetical protein H0T73_23665, partial [Ardenticatenales bacterium]|nr:hypothetical protein [Ardenticatenales bacterium]